MGPTLKLWRRMDRREVKRSCGPPGQPHKSEQPPCLTRGSHHRPHASPLYHAPSLPFTDSHHRPTTEIRDGRFRRRPIPPPCCTPAAAGRFHRRVAPQPPPADPTAVSHPSCRRPQYPSRPAVPQTLALSRTPLHPFVSGSVDWYNARALWRLRWAETSWRSSLSPVAARRGHLPRQLLRATKERTRSCPPPGTTTAGTSATVTAAARRRRIMKGLMALLQLIIFQSSAVTILSRLLHYIHIHGFLSFFGKQSAGCDAGCAASGCSFCFAPSCCASGCGSRI